MSLADYYDGGWLQAGWHHVRVVEHEVKKPTDNSCVEFALACAETSLKAKATFWLTEKAFGRLASFARACGMTREEMQSYEPMNPNDHRKLVGLECRIELARKDKYHEVVGWRSLAEGEPPPPKIDRSSEMPTAQESNRASDIPF